MKLVAVIENVNQPGNEYLIGDIVIVDSELTHDMEYELCYQELEYSRKPMFDFDDIRKSLNSMFELKHSVSNISIIGVL